jgi:hypothetical protein
MKDDNGNWNWFVRQRFMWIKECLDVYGFINREHLERKFGISTPQASNDLRRFMTWAPGNMVYNPNTKRYEKS